MATEIEAVVQSLSLATRPEDANHAYAIVDRWNREARTDDLLALSAALEDAAVPGEGLLVIEAVVDHIEEILALTAGPDHIDALFTLLARPRVKSVRVPRPEALRVRSFASRLGHGQTKDALLAAITRTTRGAHDEVLACWMHEAVLRGMALDQETAAMQLHHRLATLKHPLGNLPLTLLPAEVEAPTYMPMYGANAISRAVQRLERGPASTRTMPPPGEHGSPTFTPVIDDGVKERLLEAVEPWTTGSNGKGEAKLFRLAPPLGGAAPGKWLLRALPIESKEGDALHADRCGPEVVWGVLFAAASNGGAYSSGFGGAYGRRAAWRSLGALTEAPETATIEEIDAIAQKTMFLHYGASGGWWNDIAWDIGILALRDGGASLAVLAATDAD